mmetsp:Transcript_21482/g.46670  ORF Transcript_21482/g.46670 Transcript_21482/m.46670 type:complete len:87 (+) Transcript_21482:770-1030(+)
MMVHGHWYRMVRVMRNMSRRIVRQPIRGDLVRNTLMKIVEDITLEAQMGLIWTILYKRSRKCKKKQRPFMHDANECSELGQISVYK